MKKCEWEGCNENSGNHHLSRFCPYHRKLRDNAAKDKWRRNNLQYMRDYKKAERQRDKLLILENKADFVPI